MKNINRKTYIDFLRILANFLVIFNHTLGFALYQDPLGGIAKNSIYMLISIITKINVPLFFMITGALLLGKEEEISLILKKRVLRFFLLIACASTFMLALKFPHMLITPKVVSNIFTCYIEGSYWYLYAHLAFLLMLPYLRRVVQNFTKKDFHYFIAIHFIIFTALPIADYLSYISIGKHLTLYSEIVLPLMTVKAFFYPIIGYYLDKYVHIENISFKKLLPLLTICLAGICITEVFTFHQGMRTGFSEDFFELFDYILAITVFLVSKYLIAKKDCFQKLPAITTTAGFIAPLTLGIYILDPCWKYIVESHIFNFLLPYLPIMIISFLYCFISMILGGTVTYILKKLPFFRTVL